MTQIGMTTDELQGIYILGKAATLNGRIGDVMISDVVYDEHSGNTYWFENAFSYADLAPYLDYGAALDNQKAVTVKGPFSRTRGTSTSSTGRTSPWSRWRPGPISTRSMRICSCAAIHLVRPSICQTHRPGTLDLGIIHYASDTPYTRAQTLGARGLSYHGLDSTYASTVAILRRIFQQTVEPTESRLYVPARMTARGHRGMSHDPGLTPGSAGSSVRDLFSGPFHEVDALGHVNNAAYLNYLEQAAIDHATFLGLDLQRLQALGGVFVARRHELVFLKPTFAGDLLRVVTWLGEPRGHASIDGISCLGSLVSIN